MITSNSSEVILPPGNDIEIWQLASLIAKAKIPHFENKSGINCVIGRRESYELNGLRYFTPSSPLTDEEKEELCGLLLKFQLPSISAGMSSCESDKFLAAYRALPLKPKWEPQIATREENWNRRMQRDAIRDQHLEYFRQLIHDEKIKAYDVNHILRKNAGMNVFVSRAVAVQYLSSINLIGASANESLHSNDEKPKSEAVTFNVSMNVSVPVHVEVNMPIVEVTPAQKDPPAADDVSVKEAVQMPADGSVLASEAVPDQEHMSQKNDSSPTEIQSDAASMAKESSLAPFNRDSHSQDSIYIYI
jgi:hypothetical protein